MKGVLTSEQLLFAEAVDRFVAQEYGRGTARPNHRFDRERFSRLGAIGCLSLSVAEELGGLGGGVEAMLALMSLAPALPQEPVIESGVEAASLIAAVMPDRAEELLAPLLAGEKIAIVARGADVHASAKEGGGWLLSGGASLVAFAEEADFIVIPARDENGGLALYLLDPRAPGVALRPQKRIDGLPAAEIALTDVNLAADSRLDGDAKAALALSFDHAEAAQVAAMVGIMDALTATTISYVQTRRQFGAPIGAFQVLQHRIADMWMACEDARSLALAAALSLDDPPEARRRAVAMAKIQACESARLVGNEAIQMHGGIGMTDELIIGAWHRRLLALRASLGGRKDHLRCLTSALQEPLA
ncbi:acyl-CoA dehydrogenase [Terrarubrum flagellatum]|uniref:acyl-CoA dehydrogenase family protein n=1 Tax=Terrirubrum flagellatum TaxID=2895980 RepID=UPI0031454951